MTTLSDLVRLFSALRIWYVIFMQRQRELQKELNRLRDRLHRALDAANGNQLDPVVQRLSIDFDHAMNAYYAYLMASSRKRSAEG